MAQPPTFEIAAAKLAAWQSAHAELAALESALSDAMAEYGRTLAEPPRQLIIEIERKREQVQRLFDIAMEALDAHSIARTGHTNFGSLN
jgi:hypothetical protein